MVSVVIVTYNSSSTIKQCLDSIFRHEDKPEIIVLDNNSEDQSLKILKEYQSRIQLIESPVNLGFSKAVNKAAEKASNEHLVLLNPDCQIIEKNSLERLKDQLVEHSDYGMIAPKLLHADGVAQKSARNLPTIWRAVQEFLLGQKNAYEFYNPQGQELQSAESVVAACVVISKVLFKKIGGMDEKYFMYFEDLELCKQVGANGYKVGYYPQVEVKHIEGVSGQGSEKTRQFAIDSAKKYQGVFGYQMISLIGRLGHKIYAKK